MGHWFYIIGPILLAITLVLAAIAYKYLFKVPFKSALIFALIIMLWAVLMPRLIDYFSHCKK